LAQHAISYVLLRYVTVLERSRVLW